MKARPAVIFRARNEQGKHVVICLKKGQSFEVHTHHRTDEGYDSTYDVYHFDGRALTHGYGSHGCDCDGPLERHYTRVNTSGQWEHISSSQRDHYAEAMGY